MRRDSECTGTRGYASRRSTEAIQSPCRTDMRTDWMGTRQQWEMSTKRLSRDRSMTGRHNPEVFQTRNRRLEKPGEGRGASSTAPLANVRVTSPRAAPLMEVGAYEGMGMSSGDRGGGRRKGMRYPSQRTSTTHRTAPLSLQACQWRDRQPPDRVRQGDGSHFWKPEGFKEGADPLPPLKCLQPPEREEDAERRPDRSAGRDGSQMDRREATRT